MIKEQAEQLVRSLKISIDSIVREEWEVRVLQLLFDGAIGGKVLFKGGTALRLTYGSPRFSEDLDFSLIKGQKIVQDDVRQFIKRVTNSYPETSVSDEQMKFNTALVEFKITDPLVSRRFALKVEISTRATSAQFAPALLTSPTTNIQVLANVETLSALYDDKINALADRAKPRDLFDVWFICQKMKQPLPKNLPKISRREIKQELNRFLPLSFISVVKELEEQYGA